MNYSTPKPKVLFYAALYVLTTSYTQAQEETATEQQANKNLEEVEVVGVRKRLEKAGALADTILKTEVIGINNIEAKNAVNLSEAIDNSAGVRVSNDCSMCGFKRIMLNGLKGDQTVILVDNLPTHTLISGFYAVDAIPTTGIGSIEVARGAGASLIAPEAIGGTVNILTLQPRENSAELDISSGENGYRKIGVLGTGLSLDGATHITLIGQYDVRDQFDADDNLVSESPFMENSNYTARISHDLGSSDNVTMRYSRVNSEVFGGPVLGKNFADGKASSIGAVISRYDDVGTDTQNLFIDGNVNNAFIGKAWETSEWIETEREELALSWLHELGPKWNMTLSASYAEHLQDSFYEGFDYFADDEMLFLDAQFTWFINSSHLLTFGLDNRTEEMRSDSFAGQQSTDYVSDSFDYDVQGMYIQDRWQVNDNFDAAIAVRFDQIEADFKDPSKPGVEIDKSIISPRIDLRYMHNYQWTSRLSSGRGYRAPLSFFETDHGLLDSGTGFVVDVDELERSISATYALSYEADPLNATLSLAHTEVENLAALDETENGVPLLTQVAGKAGVSAVDLAMSYNLTDTLDLSMILESFNYDEAFRSSYTSAPIEQRVTLSMDWDINGWDLFTNLVWFGSRNLNEYGYEAVNSVSSNGEVIVDSSKTTNAPSFMTFDFRVTRDLGSTISLYFGASNLFDYTQANDEDSPLMFAEGDGGIGEYDVAYIFGPLRGREAYAGFKYSF